MNCNENGVRMPTRFAALIDLENTLIGRDGLMPVDQQEAVLRVIEPHLAGMPVHVATGERVLRACMSSLVKRGWLPTLVDATPDAADEALIDVARNLLATGGVTDLFVISGDHAFAQLAAAARLHVIAHRGRLSRKLEFAATTVTYLPSAGNLIRATA